MFLYFATFTPVSVGIFFNVGLYNPPLGCGNNTVPGKNKKLPGGGGNTGTGDFSIIGALLKDSVEDELEVVAPTAFVLVILALEVFEAVTTGLSS